MSGMPPPYSSLYSQPYQVQPNARPPSYSAASLNPAVANLLASDGDSISANSSQSGGISTVAELAIGGAALTALAATGGGIWYALRDKGEPEKAAGAPQGAATEAQGSGTTAPQGGGTTPVEQKPQDADGEKAEKADGKEERKPGAVSGDGGGPTLGAGGGDEVQAKSDESVDEKGDEKYPDQETKGGTPGAAPGAKKVSLFSKVSGFLGSFNLTKDTKSQDQTSNETELTQKTVKKQNETGQAPHKEGGTLHTFGMALRHPIDWINGNRKNNENTQGSRLKKKPSNAEGIRGADGAGSSPKPESPLGETSQRKRKQSAPKWRKLFSIKPTNETITGTPIGDDPIDTVFNKPDSTRTPPVIQNQELTQPGTAKDASGDLSRQSTSPHDNDSATQIEAGKKLIEQREKLNQDRLRRGERPVDEPLAITGVHPTAKRPTSLKATDTHSNGSLGQPPPPIRGEAEISVSQAMTDQTSSVARRFLARSPLHERGKRYSAQELSRMYPFYELPFYTGLNGNLIFLVNKNDRSWDHFVFEHRILDLSMDGFEPSHLFSVTPEDGSFVWRDDLTEEELQSADHNLWPRIAPSSANSQDKGKGVDRTANSASFVRPES